jgi:hypothetical protein
VSTGETTDASGRKVTNVITGVLTNDQKLPEEKFLLSHQRMSAMNHTMIACVFNQEMQTLWPYGVRIDNMQLLVTNVAPYMKKAAEGLPVSHPKLIHIMCVVQVLHMLYETISVIIHLCKIRS